MAGRVLIPSIEKRLEAILEGRRRTLREYDAKQDFMHPAITLTREFGCEGYPVAEKVQALLEAKTGMPWAVMDKALLEAVARNHDLNEELLSNISSKNRFLDDMFSTFSPRWKSDKDYYRLLCRQITLLAQKGNVILVGRGAAILTQNMENCYHFRIVAPMAFKVKSITRRCDVSTEEAYEMIETKQRRRDAFIRDFLGRDLGDPTLYHLIFNNARNSADRIAEIIAGYVG
ncbi:cytidylate kinase-like family protein [Geomonas sp. RF6]|uniref:cytidylate kinase-like family protein n=1 Tax=Geomonas sp. RF6 TaxID=2897342 RepID=UPI001E632637|nr:cytidylate kinase-like family protein [Geomonas sp. RF6]UFS72442.1 cytidylate kinase-like family protein [Geomonas sp. RF6]